MIKINDGIYVQPHKDGFGIYDGQMREIQAKNVSQQVLLACLYACEAADKDVDEVEAQAEAKAQPEPEVALPISGADNADEASPSKGVTMADIKATTHIPSVMAVVDSLKGENNADPETIVDAQFRDRTTPNEGCFSLESAEKIHAYLRDITHAFAEVYVATAFKDKISRSPNGEPLTKIAELGARVHDLLALVDPTDNSDTFPEDKDHGH